MGCCQVSAIGGEITILNEDTETLNSRRSTKDRKSIVQNPSSSDHQDRSIICRESISDSQFDNSYLDPLPLPEFSFSEETRN